MLEDDLNHAIALSKSGNKNEAREILKQIVQVDPKNNKAWMWLADTYPDNPNRIAVLEEFLRNNPDNQIAQGGLAALRTEEAKRKKRRNALIVLKKFRMKLLYVGIVVEILLGRNHHQSITLSICWVLSVQLFSLLCYCPQFGQG
jgi:tetratricopeptide (TPR) repeat protein